MMWLKFKNELTELNNGVTIVKTSISHFLKLFEGKIYW